MQGLLYADLFGSLDPSVARNRALARSRFAWGLPPALMHLTTYITVAALPISAAGIDVAFIFDGTAYHTARDEPSRIRRGTLQVGGEGGSTRHFPAA